MYPKCQWRHLLQPQLLLHPWQCLGCFQCSIHMSLLRCCLYQCYCYFHCCYCCYHCCYCCYFHFCYYYQKSCFF